MTALERFLCKYLPKRIKRMIFLSSLGSNIKGVDKPDLRVIKKLNEILMLSSNPNALKFPIAINSKIWGNTNLEYVDDIRHICPDFVDSGFKHLSKSQSRRVSNVFINRAPSYLLYESNTNMRRDIELLMSNIDNVFAMA